MTTENEARILNPYVESLCGVLNQLYAERNDLELDNSLVY